MDDDAHPGEPFIGSWFVSIRVGEPVAALSGTSINPLSADGMVSLVGDGTVIASIAPEYPVPDEAIAIDVLRIGTGHGTWAVTAEHGVSIRCAALIYNDRGSSVATVLVDAALGLDGENGTLSGPYTVFSHLTRGWTRNLPSLDGSVQAWRVGAPAGLG